MKTRICFLFVFCFVFSDAAWAAEGVKVARIDSEVLVRRGVDEEWQRAAVGMLLDDLDTIVTGEGAEVVLEMRDGSSFRLGGNSMLDIADLRKITERELFLYLMSEKIDNIQPRQEKIRLRVGNISAVHGESKDRPAYDKSVQASRLWRQESNGAQALLLQHFYPNAVLKLHKIIAKYPDQGDCGENSFYLGQAFAALQKPGQALDAYRAAVAAGTGEHCDDGNDTRWSIAAQKALESLQQ